VALEIRGPAAARLGRKLRRERPARPAEVVMGAVDILISGKLTKRYVRAIKSSTRELLLAHAYFLPGPILLRSLLRAARRGVRVRLLLAGRSDVPFARAATRTLYRRLLHAGCEVYEWTASVLHAKLAVIDERRLLVGSFNLDPFSRSNLETLVQVNDPQAAGAGAEWVTTRLAQARRVTPGECEAPFRRWIWEALGFVVAQLATFLGAMMRRR